MTPWKRHVAGITCLSLLAAGCLSTPTIAPTRYYTLAPEIEPEPVADTGRSLGIRPLIGARPYQLQVAYKKAPNRLAYYDHAEWAESPATLVTRSLSDALKDLGAFSDVGDAADMARPTYVLTGELRRFEADYTAEPNAVVEIGIAIREASGTVGLWDGIITAQAPLKAKSAETEDLDDVAVALSAALQEAVEELCAAVRAVTKNIQP